LIYLTKQAPEQIKLMVAGEKNEELLKSSEISEKIKNKLRLIKKSKDYFEKTLQVDTGDAYEKTIFLDREAVSYLAIRSKVNRISSIKECFPIFGCFPYLGFFEKSEAEKFLSSESVDISTYLRPVYAYSSLGKYSDRVLSPFFRFSDHKLAELIFHELLHHVFFIKDEVTVNENLATFFAKMMARDFFKGSKRNSNDPVSEISNSEKEMLRNKKRILLVEMINNLNKDKKFRKINTNKESKDYIKSQIEALNKQLREFCGELHLSSCEFDPMKWNAARLSEYKTYRSKQQFFEKLYEDDFKNLKTFFTFLVNSYEKFIKTSSKKSFVEYLKSR